MRAIARASGRHPRLVLLAWAIVFVAAAAFGTQAADRVGQPSLTIPGSDAARADRLTRQEFGGTIGMAVLLQGPPRVVERQGPGIVRDLQEIDGLQVLSPWAIGGARVLREPAGQALLALQVKRPFDEIARTTVPQVERVLEADTRGPLRAETTGLAPLVRALNSASIDSLHRAELLAMPVLFAMLLLIFGSPVAALVPALSGLLVTRVGIAVLGLVAGPVTIDALALSLVTMVGLALGVDYALLVVSRFREELADGADVPSAVEAATARAGRTVLFAGAALALGMSCAVLVAPGSLLVSAGVGVVVAAAVAVAVTLLAMPAALTVIGTNVDRWPLRRPAPGGAWGGLATRALRSPGVAACAVLLPLALLAAPALALDTGPPNIANLPRDDPARTSYEAFERARGAGWSTPYEAVFHSSGPITTTGRLRALRRFEDRMAELPGVDAVLGPSALLDRAAVLRRLTGHVTRGRGQVVRLQNGLTRTTDGTGRLATGLGAAADGAGQLATGLGKAESGSREIAESMRSAVPQTRRLADGVRQTAGGARELSGGLGKATSGSKDLSSGIKVVRDSIARSDASSEKDLSDPVAETQSAVQSALRYAGSITSPTVSGDPNVQRVKAELQRALTALGPLRTNIAYLASNLNTNAVTLKEISKGADQLAAGLTKLADGSRRLEGGIRQTADGAARAADGADQLSAGTAQLSSGLSTLLTGPDGQGGAAALARGVTRAYRGTDQLGRALKTMLASVVRVRRTSDADQAALRRNGTDLEQASASGYSVLAAVEGARPQTQTNVAFATNATSGGNTARVMIVPRQGPFAPQSAALRPALERAAQRTARRMGAAAIVGGPAVVLDDFDDATSARFPLLLLVLSLVTFLVLLAAFRAPLLALLAVVLNLVTVAAALGTLVIGFQGDVPLLGGSGRLDAIALMGTIAVVFGLSIDYEVFFMSRLVEGHAEHGTTDGAIRYALDRTAGIITGAALIMAAVFLAFAVSHVMNTRQFGVGTTVAVLLDATVVRLILLPALTMLLGERVWWVPSRLRRVPAGARPGPGSHR